MFMNIKVKKACGKMLVLDGKIRQGSIKIPGLGTGFPNSFIRPSGTFLFDDPIPNWIKRSEFLEVNFDRRSGINLLPCNPIELKLTDVKCFIEWYKARTQLTILEYGECSLYVQERIPKLEMYVGEQRATEIINTDEGSIIYFKNPINPEHCNNVKVFFETCNW